MSDEISLISWLISLEMMMSHFLPFQFFVVSRFDENYSRS